eukprot:108295_1
MIQYRGGTGGGAVKIVCDKLIMYEKSLICSNGFFDSSGNELTAGGSGGSVWVTVKKDLVVKKFCSAVAWQKIKIFRLQAFGGGSLHPELVHKLKMGGTVGVGGDGRIRVDYHTPHDIKPDLFIPGNQVYIGEGNNDENETDVNVTKSGSRKKKEHDEEVMLKDKQVVFIQSVKTNLVVKNKERVERKFEDEERKFEDEEEEKEKEFDIVQEEWRMRTYDT